MDAEKARLAASLLERVIKGELEPARAIAEWPEFSEMTRVLDVAWHDLAHFATDDDIRLKDAKYARYQVELLAKRIVEIKSAYGLK